jgi:para-aminobenzoate synthetase component 1
MNFKFTNPTVCEIEDDAETLVYALLSLDTERRLTLLDSGRNSKNANLLIAGFDPFLLFEKNSNDALTVLDEKLKEFFLPNSNEFPYKFAGGCIATLSYDLGFDLEESLSSLKRQDDEPDAFFAFYDTFVVHDYSNSKSFIVSCGGDERIKQTHEAINKATRFALEEDMPQTNITSNFTRNEYENAVARIKEYIAAGDIYQANLTQQLSCKLSSNITPQQIFSRLRRQHPAPFGAFVQRRNDTVISASPERFLRVRDRIVEGCPIKGTRPRGKNEEEDKRLREELLQSEKDRAENVMIVDLLRNDIGRVCEFGSVVVDELCALHEHPTLFHLVSKVRGTLKDKVSAGDLLRATFPCGSITGAPKIRAMEIIAETEPTPRGLSMGAIGYFSFNGSLDLNVAIRTMVLRDGVAKFNVGGGIVAESEPANEYEESLVKAKALTNALNAKWFITKNSTDEII